MEEVFAPGVCYRGNPNPVLGGKHPAYSYKDAIAKEKKRPYERKGRVSEIKFGKT